MPLLMQDGEFFDAHRAEADCLAVVRMLVGVEGAFPMLLESARLKRYRVEASESPRKHNETLRQRGYRFDGEGGRVWYRLVEEADIAAELEYLDGLYRGARQLAIVLPDNCRTRFKGRTDALALRMQLRPVQVPDPKETIATGVSTPPRKELADQELIDRITALEAEVCALSGELPELWLDAEIARCEAVVAAMFRGTYPPTYLGSGDRARWTPQQRRNWVRHLESRLPKKASAAS